MVVCGRLMAVCDYLLEVCSRLLVVCGRLMVVCDRLCLLVMVCGRLWSLPLLVTTVLKYVNIFLSLPGSYLEAKVTGKTVNREGGYKLEVPCKYCLTGQEKAIDWIKKKITSILYEHTTVVNKCLGKK